MAYQDLALRNIAGEIAVTYNDNNLRRNAVPDPVSGPRVVATATAKTGVNAEIFQVNSVAQAMEAFDSRSELATLISSAKAANEQLPMGVARVGAKPAHFILKQKISGAHEQDTLIRISPRFVQEAEADKKILSSLDSYKLILLPYVEGSLVRQRVLIVGRNFNDTQHTLVYDSERILQIDGEAAFDVEIDMPLGEILVTPDAYEVAYETLVDGSVTLAQMQNLSNLSAFKFAGLAKLSDAEATVLGKVLHVTLSDGGATVLTTADFDLEQIQGENGEFIDHVERYCANEAVYEKLEFENFQFMYCERCYADVEPVLLVDTMSTYEQVNWHKNSLGYMWRYVHNGQPYMFMFGRPAPFDDTLVDGYTHNAITYEFSAAQQGFGDLLNLVEVYFYAKAAGTTTDVETFANEKGIIECHVTFDHTIERSVADKIETPFGTLSFAANKFNQDNELVVRLRPSTIGTNSPRSCSDHILDNSYNLDPFVMTHFDLTGEVIPEAVMNRLLTFAEEGAGDATSNVLVAKNVEVREVSFLHQAAQAAYTASTNYNQVIAIVPTTPPPASSNGISQWAGNPGEYLIEEDGSVVISKNGTGVLGTKLLAGKLGYRDNAAFGGVILTNGDNLPNKIPYGIDDQDEALDSRGNPIDLGKHTVVVGAYGLVPTAESLFPKNSSKPRSRITGTKFGSAGPLIAAVLNQLAPGTEPIGPILGSLPNFGGQQRTPKRVLNDLAALRVCMVDQTGVISSIYTSALRTSDYTKISSIMSANAIVEMVRNLCLPIIGQSYDDAQIASLNQRIEGAMRLMVQQKYAQDIDVRMYASQIDRINGVLNCSITFVPPLSLEAVNIDITLQAPTA